MSGKQRIVQQLGFEFSFATLMDIGAEVVRWLWKLGQLFQCQPTGQARQQHLEALALLAQTVQLMDEFALHTTNHRRNYRALEATRQVIANAFVTDS